MVEEARNEVEARSRNPSDVLCIWSGVYVEVRRWTTGLVLRAVVRVKTLV